MVTVARAAFVIVAIVVTIPVMNFAIVTVMISISVTALFFRLAGRQIAISPSSFLALAPTRRPLVAVVIAVLIVVTVMVLVAVIVMMSEALAIIIIAVMSFTVVFRQSHGGQESGT